MSGAAGMTRQERRIRRDQHSQGDQSIRHGARVTPASVGVVIPTYGPLDDVADLLQQVISSDVPPQDRPGRVVVVDDSFPGYVDYSVLPDGVTVIRRDVNGGFGAAVNTGLAELGDLEYALIVNSDLQIPDGFLPDLLAAAQPWLPAVVGCRNVSKDGHSGYAARFFPTVGQQVTEWLVPLASQRHRDALHRMVGHDIDAERAQGVVPVDWVSGSLMLLPRAEVEAVGGFDERFFMYTEEVDLQKRLRESGIPAVYVADLAVTHEGGGSSGSEARRRRWLTNARDLYARKHLNATALHAGLAAATAVNFVWNCGRRATGREVDPVSVARFEWELVRGARCFGAQGGARNERASR